MRPEQRLRELGIELPEPLTAVGNYALAKRNRDDVFLSGHLPFQAGGTPIAGKVGEDLTLNEARDAARLAALHLLATLRAHARSLDVVSSIVKVTGYVNAAPAFTEIPAVINGCSDLLVEVFGDEIGRHARSAVGVGELPLGAAVELDMIAAVGGAARHI